MTTSLILNSYMGLPSSFGTTEIPDRSGSSFADAYGVGWLEDGKTAEFTFGIPGSELTSNSPFILMVRPSMLTLLELRFMLIVSPLTVTVNSASWPGL